VAHIFFERLERRRNTQSFVGSSWFTPIYNSWFNNLSSDFNSFTPIISVPNQYYSTSNMSWYSDQTARSSFSSLLNNLFLPQQHNWNLETRSIGGIGLSPPVSRYPDYGSLIGVLPGIGHSTVGGIGRAISIYEWEQVGSRYPIGGLPGGGGSPGGGSSPFPIGGGISPFPISGGYYGLPAGIY
jgi:hypothetical protein